MYEGDARVREAISKRSIGSDGSLAVGVVRGRQDGHVGLAQVVRGEVGLISRRVGGAGPERSLEGALCVG